MTLHDTLEGILALNPVNFDWKTQVISTGGLRGSKTGLIAQEVEAIFPELVSTDRETGLRSVSYGGLTIPMLKAMQEIGAITDPNAVTSIISESGEVTKTFVGKFFDRMIAWFADSANGIGDFFANRIHIKEVCVEKSDGTEYCVTGDQLEAAVSGGTTKAAVSPQPQPAPWKR